jgi:hypothetical protein
MTSAFADKLRPLAASLRQREAVVRPVSQIVLRLNSNARSFSDARSEVLRWIANRAGRKLPKSAWDGQTFELEEVGAQRTAAVALDQPVYWAARLDDADKEVPQRVWTTEVGIGQREDGSILFGCRLLCVTRGEDAPFPRSIPGFVRYFAEKERAMLDGRTLSIEPWIVEDEESVDEMVSLLRAPSRQADVVVLALPDGSSDPKETLIPAHAITKTIVGTAHVVILTGPASFHLSDRVGKEFSVFRQAIRTYRPGFDPDEDEPFSHPLALPHRINSWPGGGAGAYEKFLVWRTLAASVSIRDASQKLPSFTEVRRVAAEVKISSARQSGSSTLDLLKLAEEEITALRKALDEERETNAGLWKIAEQERDQAQAEALQAKETNKHLRYRIEQIEERIKDSGVGQPGHVEIPTKLDSFGKWCEAHLAGSIVIHNRALQGVNKSEYDDVALIYKALLALRDYYVPMRRNGGLDRKGAYEAECQKLGVEEQPTFSGPRAGEEGETYFVRYAGQRVELDRHLKKGNSRDPRRCFRLYFFWDEDDQQVVVGWLPSHLDTRLT